MEVTINAMQLTSAMGKAIDRCNEVVVSEYGDEVLPAMLMIIAIAFREFTEELIGIEGAKALSAEAIEMEIGVDVSKMNEQEREEFIESKLKRIISKDINLGFDNE
jgi:heterodisulfide reductase subunit B